MANSATALALRPGVLTTWMPRVAGRGDVDIDRTATGNGDQLQPGQAIHHGSGERRQMRHQDCRIADKGDDVVRLAHIFLQPVHACLGIAVLHRLIRPRLFERANGERVAADFPQGILEQAGQHEAVPDDGDGLRHGFASRACAKAAQAGGIASRTDR